jgi:Flp pilus assembly pilin Flp
VSGKATRVNIKPLTVEGMMRTSRRDRPLLIGFLLNALIEAGQKLWPEFAPLPTLTSPSLPQRPQEQHPDAAHDGRPRWRRRRDDGQGLAEYALILALVAVIAIVALLFLGNTITGVLSQLGNSI